MGLFNWLRGLLGFGNPENQPHSGPVSSDAASPHAGRAQRPRRKHRKVKLDPLRYRPSERIGGNTSSVGRRAYRFARPSMRGGWLDLSLDQDASRLERYQLPGISIPEDLA